MNNIILGLMLILIAPMAVATQCEDLAEPKHFNSDTAMEAIFCKYNREHGGTLLPLKNTAQWNAKNATILATPILAVTYRENGEHKGVLAVQRQQMLEETGEPVISHAQSAIISVYVFKYNGSRWVFEKGKMEVSDAGSYGSAPDGKLVKLGPEKYGLWFEGSYTGQGYSNDFAFIINLSAKKVLETGNFDTGQSNEGACVDDKACWGYEGKPEFIAVPDFTYYMLRIAYQGTEVAKISDDKIVSKNNRLCYVYAGDKYVETKDKNCANYKALSIHNIFGIEDKAR